MTAQQQALLTEAEIEELYTLTPDSFAFARRIESAVLSRQAGVQPGWQDIATAPKGKMLLLAAEFDGPGDWRIKVGYYDEALREWRIWGASWTPTHFMPLPPPPPSAGKDQE